MLVAMKWEHFAVPFRFYVLRPYRFLRGMQALRRDSLKAFALDIAAFSGLGWTGIRGLQAWKKARAGRDTNDARRVTIERSFGAWADEVWNECAPEYPLIAVRDQRSLNVLFPPENKLFCRLRISRADGGVTLGWAVVSTRQMQNHPQYGNLRTGQIVDALARPGDAAHVVAAAVDALHQQSADIVICNHSHAAWVAAMDGAGFLSGPSNFIFAAPPALTALFTPFADYRDRLFFTRADGDGLYRFV
jgi:hypothetical protein